MEWRSYKWIDLLAYVDGKASADTYGIFGPDELSCSPDDWIGEGYRLAYYSMEMTDSVRSLLYAIGLRFTDTTVDVRCIEDGNPVEILRTCGMVADAVTSSYDMGGNEPDHHHYRNQWDLFGLGGDDDVDYNGSYITIIVDILIDYIMDQPPPVPPWNKDK